MKKTILLFVISISLVFTGCAKTGNTVPSMEQTEEAVSEKSEENANSSNTDDSNQESSTEAPITETGEDTVEDTSLSESISYSVCEKEVKSEDGTDLFLGEYVQFLSSDSSLESVISEINSDIEKDNEEKIEEYSAFAKDDSENIVNSGMAYYLKPTKIFAEKNDDEIISIGIMREGYIGGSMNNMLDFYNINVSDGTLINMDQVLKISDKNAGKIVEGLSLAYFEGNMSEEYQAEAIDAFNNGQTQFSIQDDDSIMIYFYQDTLKIPVSWAAVCVEVDSEGNVIQVIND